MRLSLSSTTVLESMVGLLHVIRYAEVIGIRYAEVIGFKKAKYVFLRTGGFFNFLVSSIQTYFFFITGGIDR